MSDDRKREETFAELHRVVSALSDGLEVGQIAGSDMILGCRRILNLWVNGGGSSVDDEIVSFTSIESQSDYVLGGSQAAIGRDVDGVRFELGSAAEQAEVAELWSFFADSFKRAVIDLKAHLDFR